EDPEKQKATIEKVIELSTEAIQRNKIDEQPTGTWLAYDVYAKAQIELATNEINKKTKQTILEKSKEVILEGIEKVKPWKILSGSLFLNLSKNQRLLAEVITNIEEKRRLLQESKNYAMMHLEYLEKMRPFASLMKISCNYQLALVLQDLAKISINKKSRINLLRSSIDYLSSTMLLIRNIKERFETSYGSGIGGKFFAKLGETLHELSLLTKDEKMFQRAIETYKQSLIFYMKAEMPTHAAESFWHLAQLYDQMGEFHEASNNYEKAAQAYERASKKIPQLKNFYKDYSFYMQAWSQIEQARHSHFVEDYEEATQSYEQAAELHESTTTWSYLTPNYFAWSYMEKAESLSRKENAQLAKETFQKAVDQFSNAKESLKQKIDEITSTDEKEMAQRLFKGSDLRRKYCQARILIEEAKLLDREGKHLQSSKKYGKAAQIISVIVDKIDAETEHKELEYVTILCRAWRKMAMAEERTSAESYWEAAELFQKAKDYCYTRKGSLWALGNSNFCKGLAVSIRYKTNMDLKENALAKRYIKDAASSYSEAGFKYASEYAKATQRLFDAYIFMNQAESEVDSEKKAKQYQMAENLLNIAAGSFMKAKQPEKTAQVQRILANVKEEKALAISLSQVMQAPLIASTTSSFAAPTSTSESSVGLEKFEHANVQANLVTTLKQVKVGESFCLSVEFVNAGREPALLMRVDDFVPSDFVVVKKPEIYRLEDACLNMKGKQLAPLKFVEVKLTLQSSKKGEYRLNPRVHYLDELGQNKSLQLRTLELNVEEVILEDRVTTGTEELDSLLLGGIPEEYAVVLSGPPCDEREMIVNNFLRARVEEGISFYVSTEASDLEGLLDSPNFFLFLCNPKPKTNVPDSPNVYKLQSKTDLNNLGIALTKAYRNLDTKLDQPKRMCIEILSEVLEDYGSKTTRKWISDFITNYGAKGFTLLAVINPRMHASEDLYAVLDLFDGEISITQSEDPLDCKKSILVKKLRNQDYIKNPICLP
ncbi:tetratricopeptide repeat protein, partial [Candidatus Bathyarchaeota archaeon]